MVNKMAMLLSVSSRIGLCTLRQGYTKPGRLSFVPWRLTFVGLQCGTCFMSSWLLKFGGGSLFFYVANLYNLPYEILLYFVRIGMNRGPQKQTCEHILFWNVWQNPVCHFYCYVTGIFINPSCEVFSYDPCSPDSSLPAILGVSATCLQNYVVVQDTHLAQEELEAFKVRSCISCCSHSLSYLPLIG